jgi:hypothetical protein
VNTRGLLVNRNTDNGKLTSIEGENQISLNTVTHHVLVSGICHLKKTSYTADMKHGC